MLLVALAFLFVIIWATRPGSNLLFRGRYRMKKGPQPFKPVGTTKPDHTSGFRDPSRRL